MDEHAVWENLPMRRRTELVAQVLGGEPSSAGDKPPYTDAAVALRLIEQLAAEGRLSALHVHFDLWPHAWSLFLETPIAWASGEIHVIGETFGDAVAKGALSLHDVDVDGRYAGTEGTPSEQRALQSLAEPVSRLLARALLEDTRRDLLVAYRRAVLGGPMSRDELALRVVRELQRMAAEDDAEGDATL